MSAGLFACFHVTCCNLFFFSTVLVNFDYEINRSLLESSKEVPIVILGFGTVTSVVFLFIAMIKTIGNCKTFFLEFLTLKLVLTYFDIKFETNDNETEDKMVKVN